MANKDKNQQAELPTVSEVMKQIMNSGTVLGALEFPEKPIRFTNTPQSAVKTLAVKICSTETQITDVLHKLHSQTRLV
jgi:hypothetical protein